MNFKKNIACAAAFLVLLTGFSACTVESSPAGDAVAMMALLNAVPPTPAPNCAFTELEDNGSAVNADSLSTCRSGTIHGVGDEDYYKFYSYLGEYVELETDDGSGGCSMDTYLTLYDGSFVETTNDDGGFGVCSYIYWYNDLGTGYYYVKVNEFGNNETGSYRLTVYFY